MRLGAAIIVVIGLLIASLTLFERTSAPERKRLDNYKQELNNSSWESREKFQDEADSFFTCYAIMWDVHTAAIIALVFWFFKVSKQRSGFPNYMKPPRDFEQVLDRLYEQEPCRFRYGILTLLALMLAVAIVCSAIYYPLGK
jgi:hypothetical protein